MGKKHARARQLLNESFATKELTDAEARRQTGEQERQSLESLLGSEEQAGLAEVSADVLPYTQRYDLDLAYYSRAHQPTAGLTDIRSEANALLEQAQEAASVGNLDEAASLKQQAADFIGGQHYAVSGGFSLVENPAAAARIRAASPQGQTVGELVREGRDFLDPASETSREYRRLLTENAQRTLAADARGAARAARDIGPSRGAARGVQAERAIAGRVQAEFGYKSALIETEASATFEQFRRQFAADSVGLARAWTANTPGIRDSYFEALDRLSMSASQQFEQRAVRAFQEVGEAEATHQARRAAARQVAIVAGGLILGAVTGGLGTMTLAGAAKGAVSVGSIFAGVDPPDWSVKPTTSPPDPG